MWTELCRYQRLSGRRKWLLWEALISLALARIATACLPFRRIALWLGTPGTETPVNATNAQVQIAQEIGWSVECLARRVPWDGRCLAQALAATGMLRRRGLEGTVTFGAERGQSGHLIAHAWLRFGPCSVTGGRGYEQFKTITSIARTPS